MEAALKAAGKTAEFHIYPGAPHGFHADYRPSYRKEAAEDGWNRMVGWFKKYNVLELTTARSHTKRGRTSVPAALFCYLKPVPRKQAGRPPKETRLAIMARIEDIQRATLDPRQQALYDDIMRTAAAPEHQRPVCHLDAYS